MVDSGLIESVWQILSGTRIQQTWTSSDDLTSLDFSGMKTAAMKKTMVIMCKRPARPVNPLGPQRNPNCFTGRFWKQSLAY